MPEQESAHQLRNGRCNGLGIVKIHLDSESTSRAVLSRTMQLSASSNRELFQLHASYFHLDAQCAVFNVQKLIAVLSHGGSIDLYLV